MIEKVGSTEAGLEINLYRSIGGESMTVEILDPSGRIATHAANVPELMILLSIAHERATRKERESPCTDF